MTDLRSRIASLSPEKRALLELRLLKKAPAAAEAATIPRRATADPCLLSFAQQRLWFLDQLEPNSPVYNVNQALRLTGRLDRSALQAALDAIVARHEALRTTFVSEAEGPRQVIHASRVVDLPVIDLGAFPEAEREDEVRRLAREEAGRPFDLSRDLLLRATLLRLEDEEHVLLLTLHHIASDGWSMGILYRELGALYQAAVEGRSAPLSPLPIQYADFAVWQRQWLQGEVLERQLSYWKQQLAGAPSLLPLPTDRPRPPLQSYQGARQVFTLPRELTEELKVLSQREGATLFMTLLAAFQALLGRYTGQEDLVVGSPIAGRTRVETEGLIGFFVNTLALRTDLSGAPSFRELISRVREVALGAFAHQDVPFEKLVEELQPERNASHTPFFQAVFVLQNAPRDAMNLAGLTLRSLEVDGETAKFDLSLSITDTDQGLRGVLTYKTDLFEGATIARMQGHFRTLLEGIAADPDQRLSRLPLLTRAERQQLLVEWNETTTADPRGGTIHQLFEAQVERTPEAIAVTGEHGEMTYRALNERANQLAHFLRRRGVGPEVRVGICVERSLDMIVGLLGILKAGGTYVPLDPSYPPERLALMLEDSQAPVLVTTSGIQDGPDPTPEYPNPRTPERLTRVCLDSDGDRVTQESTENLSLPVTADHLAYVMYTSGSTGRPKGVGVPHRGVVRLVRGPDYVRLDAGEVFLQFAPLSFDASTLEIWGALLNGARLVIFPAGTPSLAELGAALQRHQVSTLWLTAGLFHQMVEHERDGLRGVRQLLAGGDVLSVPHVQRAASELPGCQLINGYGPTENTTFTCCWRVPTGWNSEGSVPIGRPIAGTQVYLLDRNLQPVPVGVTGELYAGGDGLARGYLNDPGLTAEKFLPHPFTDQAGARLYRTGDLARYLPDGTLEFLGRRDQQVKLRGYRIELGEIEAALGQHPAVAQCLVLVRDDDPDDRRLVAYVVPISGIQDGQVTQTPEYPNTPSPERLVPELRSFLRQKLPEYMVPAAFVLLEALPLTPNGKVDRQALPMPEGVRPALEETFVAPRTPPEEAVAAIWAELLRLDRVGVHDSFFRLGGHSLLATQVISRIRAVFQVEVPLRALFDAPTVAGLCQAILPEPEEPPDRANGGASRGALRPLESRVEELSEAEVDALLQHLLAEEAERR